MSLHDNKVRAVALELMECAGFRRDEDAGDILDSRNPRAMLWVKQATQIVKRLDELEWSEPAARFFLAYRDSIESPEDGPYRNEKFVHRREAYAAAVKADDERKQQERES
jgi:hypothetical protein